MRIHVEVIMCSPNSHLSLRPPVWEGFVSFALQNYQTCCFWGTCWHLLYRRLHLCGLMTSLGYITSLCMFVCGVLVDLNLDNFGTGSFEYLLSHFCCSLLICVNLTWSSGFRRILISVGFSILRFKLPNLFTNFNWTMIVYLVKTIQLLIQRT